MALRKLGIVLLCGRIKNHQFSLASPFLRLVRNIQSWNDDFNISPIYLTKFIFSKLTQNSVEKLGHWKGYV